MAHRRISLIVLAVCHAKHALVDSKDVTRPGKAMSNAFVPTEVMPRLSGFKLANPGDSVAPENGVPVTASRFPVHEAPSSEPSGAAFRMTEYQRLRGRMQPMPKAEANDTWHWFGFGSFMGWMATAGLVASIGSAATGLYFAYGRRALQSMMVFQVSTPLRSRPIMARAASEPIKSEDQAMKPSQEQSKNLMLTIESICTSPALCGPSPMGLQLAPDSSCITFLRGREEDKDYRDLWTLDLSTNDAVPKRLVDADRLGFSAESDGSELSAEEKARRERLRVAQSKGILQYFWSSNSEYIMIPADTQLWMFKLKDASLAVLPVTKSEKLGAIIDPKLSPKSNYVSYVRQDGNLYVFKLSGGSSNGEMSGSEGTLTADGTDTVRNGLAEYIAQEEMNRSTAYWWSPTEKFIAFTRTDESLVENVQRNEIFAEGVSTTTQRYPYAGKRNAECRLGIVEVEAAFRKPQEAFTDSSESTGSPPKLWIPLEEEEKTKDFYLPRVKWVSQAESADAQEVLSYQYQSRDQTLLRVQLGMVEEGWNCESGKDATLSMSNISPLLAETQPESYVNLNTDGDLHFCSKNEKLKGIFFWLSERDNGFMSVYIGNRLHSSAGLHRITGGKTEKEFYVTDAIEFIDEEKMHLYFTGRKDSVIEKHLYRLDFAEAVAALTSGRTDVDFKDLKTEKITQKTGFHQVLFSSKSETPVFLDSFSYTDQPPQHSLWRANSEMGKPAELIQWVEENNFRDTKTPHPLLPYYENLNVKPEFGTFKADDGETDIYYRMFVPKSAAGGSKNVAAGGKKHPVLVFVYGGPHVQVCSTASRWSESDLFLQYFVQQGYIVFSVDNRGSAGRGLKFESSIHLDAGQREISDQVMGIQEILLKRPDVDPDRICMYGHSYGGYMSLMCLFRAYRDVDTGKCGYYTWNESQNPPTAEILKKRKPLFRCAVSGAPVSRWDLYDTHYTERYMGAPTIDEIESPGIKEGCKFNNKHGYAASKVHEYVQFYDDSQSRLLMYHGMADDNVLFQHSTEIYDVLIKQGKLFDQFGYPGAKHSMVGEDTKIHLYKMIWDFVSSEMQLPDRPFGPGPFGPGPFGPGPVVSGPFYPDPFGPGPFDPGPFGPGPFGPGPFYPDPFGPGPFYPEPFWPWAL